MKNSLIFLGRTAPFTTSISLSFIVGIFSYISAQKLPKPETIKELIKYSWDNPQDYAIAIILFFLVSILFFTCSITAGFKVFHYFFDDDYYEWNYEKPNLEIWQLITLGILCLVFLFLSLYFLFYFLKTLAALIIILGMVFVIVKVISE